MHIFHHILRFSSFLCRNVLSISDYRISEDMFFFDQILFHLSLLKFPFFITLLLNFMLFPHLHHFEVNHFCIISCIFLFLHHFLHFLSYICLCFFHLLQNFILSFYFIFNSCYAHFSFT